MFYKCYFSIEEKKKAFTVSAEDGIWIWVIRGLWFTENLFASAAAWVAGRAVAKGRLQAKRRAVLLGRLGMAPGPAHLPAVWLRAPGEGLAFLLNDCIRLFGLLWWLNATMPKKALSRMTVPNHRHPQRSPAEPQLAGSSAWEDGSLVMAEAVWQGRAVFSENHWFPHRNLRVMEAMDSYETNKWPSWTLGLSRTKIHDFSPSSCSPPLRNAFSSVLQRLLPKWVLPVTKFRNISILFLLNSNAVFIK